MLQGLETWRFRPVDRLLFLSRASFTSESVRDDSEKMYGNAWVTRQQPSFVQGYCPMLQWA
jgi:hypothetical protein